MKASQTPLFTVKESPKSAQVVSHKLLIRAGYARQHFSGLYTYLPFGWIVHRKIEQIVREEMNKYGGVEVHLPILTSADLWKKSGRWASMGPEMVRLKDRHESQFCLAPTHEEAITDLASNYLTSYKQLPTNLYQIGIKYRDEIRPRYGLIRCKEFMMKDAYSFHLDDTSLNEVYQKMRACYRSVFDRCDLQTIPVEADSGSMGGTDSEEFMVISQIGEATLLLADDQNKTSYRSNQDRAEFIPSKEYPKNVSGDLELKGTPNVKKIEEVSKVLQIDPIHFIKAVIVENDHSVIIAFIPGDRDINLTKLQNISGENQLKMATTETIQNMIHVPTGFVGPYKLPVKYGEEVSETKIKKKILIYFDRNLKDRGGLVAGGNEADKHYINLQEGRDFNIPDHSKNLDLILAVSGDICPTDKTKRLISKKGIELGHIFKLGKKYTSSLGVTVLDKNGKSLTPTMGCYGIGVSRTLQASIEQHHDENGIVWPEALAPYLFYMIGLFHSEDQFKKLNYIYDQLKKHSMDVYFDNRKERPGVKFNDADLVGFPWQIIIGKKYFESSKFELKNRKSGVVAEVTLEEFMNRFKK